MQHHPLGLTFPAHEAIIFAFLVTPLFLRRLETVWVSIFGTYALKGAPPPAPPPRSTPLAPGRSNCCSLEDYGKESVEMDYVNAVRYCSLRGKPRREDESLSHFLSERETLWPKRKPGD